MVHLREKVGGLHTVFRHLHPLYTGGCCFIHSSFADLDSPAFVFAFCIACLAGFPLPSPDRWFAPTCHPMGKHKLLTIRDWRPCRCGNSTPFGLPCFEIYPEGRSLPSLASPLFNLECNDRVVAPPQILLGIPPTCIAMLSVSLERFMRS